MQYYVRQAYYLRLYSNAETRCFNINNRLTPNKQEVQGFSLKCGECEFMEVESQNYTQLQRSTRDPSTHPAPTCTPDARKSAAQDLLSI